jgi:hypothetical protein
MANETGTATDLEDLFTKVVTFVTTNSTLTGLNQEWEVLRQHRDNIAVFTSPMVENIGGASHRKMLHTFRYDARSLSINNAAQYQQASTNVTSVVMGTSYLRWQLRATATIATVRIRATPDASQLAFTPRSWRLQYSDNGTTWTTALTVTTPPAFTAGEWRDFAVGGSPGSHVYWQIILDGVQGGSTNVGCWAGMLLLRADGSVANHFGSEVILKGQGNASTDEIFVGLRSEYDEASGWHNFFVNGYSGYDANNRSWLDQPGALPQFGAANPLANPVIPLWNSPMPYWISANGRSIKLAVKVSTSYEGMYLGFMLPYATPGQFPYPLVIGGSLMPQDTARGAEWRYSYANYRHGVFPGPAAEFGPSTDNRSATLYLRDTSGEWRFFGNRPDGSQTADGVAGMNANQGGLFNPSGSVRSVWPHCMNDQVGQGKRAYRDCLGGGYVLQPCVLLQRSPTFDLFGELDGVYAISGYDNAPENTTTFGGKTHVIFGNAYRTTPHEYWALKLE